ncbi:MAG TPA: aconitate hydratase [Candidatus Methanofastidiosa archaeon]|nr:aconitate hydratase [Candidatus Methanofastidiosa archaeon]
MGKNIVEKIIDLHRMDENKQEIGIRVDQTLTQDSTGTMVYLELETIGIDRVRTELSVAYVDHNTLQFGYENADDHNYLRTVTDKYGIVYSPPGNGICHQVHLERFSEPGKTLLGSDSHTPTSGGIGCLAIGAGGIDVAAAMAGEPFYLPTPKVMKVELRNSLPPNCEAKDIILKILSILTTKGNVGYIIEYGGEGVSTLSVPERATICNMGAELGVTTSIFPSDDVTREFLEAQQRKDSFRRLTADDDAHYDKVMEIDLSKMEPLVATPHSPDNVERIEDLQGLDVQQVCIGSCTNASLYDMAVAATILKGKRAGPGMSLIIAPGSRQVLLTLAKMGMMQTFIESGARIMEPACGFCLGIGQAPCTDANSLRTNNRNFYGRSGTNSAGIYLMGVKAAAASALEGKLVMPGDLDGSEPLIADAKRLNGIVIDDSRFVHPTGKDGVIKGPNIGPPPTGEPLGKSLHGVAALKVGDKITTDHIMPAGVRLKYRSNIPKYSEYVFEGVDPEFPQRMMELHKNGMKGFIIGGESYGQGSSREHAAICPAYLGVRCIIAKSIERIHRANLINFGILPLVFLNELDYDMIEQGDELELGDIEKGLEGPTFTLHDRTKNLTILLKGEFSPREKRYLHAGGKLFALKG